MSKFECDVKCDFCGSDEKTRVTKLGTTDYKRFACEKCYEDNNMKIRERDSKIFMARIMADDIQALAEELESLAYKETDDEFRDLYSSLETRLNIINRTIKQGKQYL